VAYAAVTNVQSRNPGRPISALTAPSTDQVTDWITEAEAELKGALQEAGIALPSEASDGGKIIRGWVSDYLGGRVRQAYFGAGGEELREDPDVSRWYERLDAIREDPGRFDGLLNGGVSSGTAGRFRSYVTHNDDGKSVAAGDFAPTFTRDPPEEMF
jgi:hypothetical protein